MSKHVRATTRSRAWEPGVLKRLPQAVEGDEFWSAYVRETLDEAGDKAAIHLAVFTEPYLEYLLAGQKTVESRFSVHRCAPYERVCSGDILLLKRSSGPVVGICTVSHVWFYKLDPESWKTIRNDFAKPLCAQEPSFWHARRAASFATLMTVKNVRPISPIKCQKRDRRGWVVIRSTKSAELFEAAHE